jgi:hypothetical protein
VSDKKYLLERAIILHNMIDGNQHCQVPLPVNRDGKEYRVVPDRKWRFDYAYPELKIGIEVHGGIWTRGGHTRGSGFIKDREKFNRAAIAGWLVLEFPIITTDTLPSDCVEMIKAAIEARKATL